MTARATATLRVDGSALRLDGELGYTNAATLLPELSRAIAAAPAAAQMTVDLSGVTRADSAALALLLEVCGVARRCGRHLRVVQIPDGLRRLAKIAEIPDEAFGQA